MEKMRQWSMLTGLAVVVVLAAGWFLAVSPQRHQAASLRTQVVSQQSSNAQLLSQIDQLKQQKQGLPAQQRLLDQIAAKVPDNPALPALIRELSTAANVAGVDLESLAPAAPAPVAATASGSSVTPVAPAGASSVASAAGAAQPLEQISLVIKVNGSYYNVESFFAAIEKMKRAMRITQWTATPGTPSAAPASGTSSSTGTVAKQLPPDTLEASLTAFVYESPALASPTHVTPLAPVATSK